MTRENCDFEETRPQSQENSNTQNGFHPFGEGGYLSPILMALSHGCDIVVIAGGIMAGALFGTWVLGVFLPPVWEPIDKALDTDIGTTLGWFYAICLLALLAAAFFYVLATAEARPRPETWGQLPKSNGTALDAADVIAGAFGEARGINADRT